MRLQLICILSFFPFYISCQTKSEKKGEGLITQTTHFYKESKSIALSIYLRLWHKDSTSIQEITGVNTVTDSKNQTTTTYPILFYRYIDLKKKVITDFTNFTDTASIISQSILPDSLLTGPGWSYYSEKHPVISGEPVRLTDTTINEINFRRYKLQFTFYDPDLYYSIGYFRCDRNENLFSMEKSFSRKINCIQVKNYSFQSGKSFPYASREIEFTRDYLTSTEKKILEAWEIKSAHKL